MWIGSTNRGEWMVHDTAWCEDPLDPSVIRCCSIFKFEAFRYKIATPPLCWCCSSSFRDACCCPYIPSAVNQFFRAESRWQMMFCQDNHRNTLHDRQTQDIFPFLLWESVDIYRDELKIYMCRGRYWGLRVTLPMWRCLFLFLIIYVCLCICMHIHLYTRACGCTYVLV